MTDLQLTIPAQDRDSRGIRLKPREVRDWLQNLPYMDTARTLQLANQQLRLLNRQAIAPAARLEILEHFLRTYQRLTETMLGDMASASQLQPLLKKLCQNIGFGYKILVAALAGGKGGLLDARHLPKAMLGALHTFGQQLLHHYAHYQRVPRAVWSECLAIYLHAQRMNRGSYAASLAGNAAVTIDATFRLNALLKLANPYQLRAGMLMALQQYFRTHIDLTGLAEHPDLFPDAAVLTLNVTGQHPHDNGGIDIDVTALLKQIQNDIARLEQGKPAQVTGLSTDSPAATLLAALQQTLQYWQAQPERKSVRESAAIGVELVVGLEAAYAMINRNRPFDPSLYLTGDEDNEIDIGSRGNREPAAQRQPAAPLHCSTIDRTNGGIGISHRSKSPALRVGTLVAVRRAVPNAGGWILGVLRWVVEPESLTGFDAGLQYLAGDSAAVVIRPLDANGFGGEFQPALTAYQKRGDLRVQTLIARGNQLQAGDTLTLYDDRGTQRRARCIELLEAGTGFDRFIYQLTQ